MIVYRIAGGDAIKAEAAWYLPVETVYQFLYQRRIDMLNQRKADVEFWEEQD